MDDQPMHHVEDEFETDNMVGVVKIKDGLFICDEFGAQVSEILRRLVSGF